jgi:hypothetical protein
VEEAAEADAAAFEPVTAVADPASAAASASASEACARRTPKGTPMWASERDRGEMRQSREDHFSWTLKVRLRHTDQPVRAGFL